MSFSVVIPARFGSTRLQGKPLLDIAGKPMIQWVYEQALKSNANNVIVATDDERIFAAVKAFGGNVEMTLTTHQSGTDRLQEIAEIKNFSGADIIVNVQGDEPLIPPEVINQVADNLCRHVEAGIATLCEPITDIETLMNPNAVKVVTDNQGFALTFSRAPIPWARDCFEKNPTTLPSNGAWFRHVGFYAYRVSFLHEFVLWPASTLEQVEKLEQLRALSNGVDIHVAQASCAIPAGVDTQEDLQRVRGLLEKNG